MGNGQEPNTERLMEKYFPPIENNRVANGKRLCFCAGKISRKAGKSCMELTVESDTRMQRRTERTTVIAVLMLN